MNWIAFAALLLLAAICYAAAEAWEPPRLKLQGLGLALWIAAICAMAFL